MRKIWERVIRKEYWPGEDRPHRYYGSAEVIGITPSADFVAPVMALDMFPIEEPIILVMQIHDYPEVPIVRDGTEEQAAAATQWEADVFGPDKITNRFLMEVRT